MFRWSIKTQLILASSVRRIVFIYRHFSRILPAPTALPLSVGDMNNRRGILLFSAMHASCLHSKVVVHIAISKGFPYS